MSWISDIGSTVAQAGTNVWNGITWNLGYLFGNSSQRQQVSKDIDSQKQTETDYYKDHPGATQEDYRKWLQDNFIWHFGQYAATGNVSGMQDNPSSNKVTDWILGGAIIIIIISLFRD